MLTALPPPPIFSQAPAAEVAPQPDAASQAMLRVGSLRGDRIQVGPAFELATGEHYAAARAELADGASFGPGGVVDLRFEVVPAVFELTPPNLVGSDIFWADLLAETLPLAPAEQLALYDFVAAGGALVVIADVGRSFSAGPSSVAAPFGVAWDGVSWLEQDPAITAPLHPLFFGPFGVVGEIAGGWEGSMHALGSQAVELASNAPGSSIAVLPAGALGPCSGPAVFLSDVNFFTTNPGPTGVGFDLGENRVLFRNLFAFLAQNTPGTAAPAEVIRAGNPPNPIALLPGATSGPVLGATWDPRIDHATFLPAAVLDLLGVAVGSANVPLGPLGTLLCDVTQPPLLFTAGPGAPFSVPIPPDCNLLGAGLCAQGASSDGAVVRLTNALDIVLGAL
ncbi:MAG: hypothetical protein AAF682_15515 [Planctomycetota bacterium]